GEEVVVDLTVGVADVTAGTRLGSDHQVLRRRHAEGLLPVRPALRPPLVMLAQPPVRLAVTALAADAIGQCEPGPLRPGRGVALEAEWVLLRLRVRELR